MQFSHGQKINIFCSLVAEGSGHVQRITFKDDLKPLIHAT